MKLIVGLGNPDEKYQNTRHNIGFMALDYIHDAMLLAPFKKKFNGEIILTKINNEDVLFLKPQTYMNLSGESVHKMMEYFKIDIKDVLVIYDDLDLDFASLRLREKGNPGTHNGIRNITLHLHSNDFARIRIGIGKPHVGEDMANYVLSKFNKEDLETLNNKFKDVLESVKLFIDNKFNMAMNKYNSGKVKNEANN